MEEYKFTIITRIFNSEKYLAQTIESVLSQNYSNWELLLINDGSTDNSLEICNEYKQKDKRIKVFSKKNSGGAKSELWGFELASGDYIFTLDAEDWFPADTLYICNEKIRKYDCDILLFGINEYTEEGFFLRKNSFALSDTLYSRLDFIRYVLESTVHGLFKVYKKSIVTYTSEEKEYFEKKGELFTLNNDILLGFPLMFNASNVLVIPQCFYNYRIMNSSCTHIKKPYNKINVALYTFEYLEWLFNKNNLSTDIFINLIFREIIREIVNNVKTIISLPRMIDIKRIHDINRLPTYRSFYMQVKQSDVLCDIAFIDKLLFLLFSII